MSEDERPGEDRGQDELIAAFAALGGPLTGEEFMRLLGSDEYYDVMVRLAALLLDGDTARARDVVQDSLSGVQHAWSRFAQAMDIRIGAARSPLTRGMFSLQHRPRPQ